MSQTSYARLTEREETTSTMKALVVTLHPRRVGVAYCLLYLTEDSIRVRNLIVRRAPRHRAIL